MTGNWLDALQSLKDSDPSLQLSPQEQEQEQELTADTRADEPKQPRVDILLERKGRAGKTATLVTGWIVSQQRLLEIASELKQKLGVGGSARGGDILIQGDRRQQVKELLESMGYKSRII